MSDKQEWPVVTEDDSGIRPAIDPQKCFYCDQSVGEPHKKDCVCVEKKVLYEYTFKIEKYVPHFWGNDLAEFHITGSSWCANNSIRDIEENSNRVGCLCEIFTAEFIEVLDSTPIANRKEPLTYEDRIWNEAVKACADAARTVAPDGSGVMDFAKGEQVHACVSAIEALKREGSE